MINIDEVERHVRKEIERIKGREIDAIIIGEVHADPYHAAFKDLFVKQAKEIINNPLLLIEGAITGDFDTLYAATKYVPDVKYFQRIMQELQEKGILPKIPPLHSLTREDLKYLHNQIDRALKDNEVQGSKYILLRKYIQWMLKEDDKYMGIRRAAGLTEDIPIDGLESYEAHMAALKAAGIAPEALKKAQEHRNKAFAESIASAVSEGYTPIAIMGINHVDQVKQMLEKKGIRVHTVKINKVTINDEDLRIFEKLLERNIYDSIFK